VAHDHDETAAAMRSQRYRRGQEFARVRAHWEGWSTPRRWAQVLASPGRLARVLRQAKAAATAAGWAGEFQRTWHLHAGMQAAWVAGEARGHDGHRRPGVGGHHLGHRQRERALHQQCSGTSRHGIGREVVAVRPGAGKACEEVAGPDIGRPVPDGRDVRGRITRRNELHAGHAAGQVEEPHPGGHVTSAPGYAIMGRCAAGAGRIR
jgi:hypothetical protein